jgi:hypothetical protein
MTKLKIAILHCFGSNPVKHTMRPWRFTHGAHAIDFLRTQQETLAACLTVPIAIALARQRKAKVGDGSTMIEWE